jgi:hypothetical protein
MDILHFSLYSLDLPFPSTGRMPRIEIPTYDFSVSVFSLLFNETAFHSYPCNDHMLQLDKSNAREIEEYFM